DLLAVNLPQHEHYHVECSVTHRLQWAPKPDDLRKVFEKKFLGLPEKRDGAKTDSARGKTYQQNILQTYQAYGLDPGKVQRVFVCWVLNPKSPADTFLHEFEEQHGMTVSVLSFRDTIIPELRDAVGTANYDDLILRTFGFFKEYENQKGANKRLEPTR